MKPTADDIKNLIAELNDYEGVLAFDLLGEEGIKELSRVCIEWVIESFKPEKGDLVSVKSSTEIIQPMVAMSIGFFELGWKAHELMQLKEVIPKEQLH